MLPAAQLAEMTDLDRHNIGLAAWPLCPCRVDADGRKRSIGVGHTYGSGGLYHVPEQQLALFARVSPASDDLGPLFTDLTQVVIAALHDDAPVPVAR